MKYNIETIVVTENCQRFDTYSPNAAWKVTKENNGTIFFRCRELKMEQKVVFIGGRIIELRLKVNRKVVDDVESLSHDVQDCLDYLNEAIGLWNC